MVDISRNLTEIRAEIAATAVRCGRAVDSVRLLAVSKTFPADWVDIAAEAGQTMFGENRVQEAEEKVFRVRTRGVEWHLIGHLQSNKARRAVQLFDVIQTVDSEKLARTLDRHASDLAKRLPVLIEVNVGEETQKAGLNPRELPALVRLIGGLSHLELRGLMAIPPYSDEAEDSRPYFRRLAALRDEARLCGVALPELSMGMSHDFRVAIEEGATLVRLGTAVFGPRVS